MSEQYKLIKATHYNDIQSKIANVLGTGSNDYGYGQTVLSSQISPGAKISVNQWSNLRTDILKARIHQTGSATLKTPRNTTVITDEDRLLYTNILSEDDRNTYLTMANACETDRYVIPPLSQVSQDVLVTGTKNVSWNSTMTHTVTITFTNDSEMRYFFNSGSCIDISASRSNGSSTTKNTSWTSLLSDIGTIRIAKYNSYQVVGANSVLTSVIGASDLTTSESLIYTKSPSTGFTSNSYNIRAKLSTSSSATIILTISFIDADGTEISDVNVDGTLISIVKAYRASGDYVSVSAPSATGEFSGGEVVPVYAIGINSTSVNEGSSFNITISGQAVPPSVTTYYLTTLTTAGVVNADDFNTGDYFNGNITVSLTTSANLDKNFIYTDTSILRADLRSEGIEKFKLQLRTGSASGTVIATSPEITVNDTSITSESFSISANVTSVNEGGTVTFTIYGNAVTSSSTTYYLTTSGTATSPDFTSGFYNNNPITVALTADTYGDQYFTKVISAVLSADQASEGSENFKLQLRDTLNGNVLADSASITVNDTSVTIATVTVPSTVYVLNDFSYSISGGVANDTWYVTTTAPNKPRFPASGTLSLNSSGAYSNTGSFYPDVGTFDLVFHFGNGTEVTKTISVVYSSITITGTGRGTIGQPYSWTVANGPISGTYTVSSSTGYASGPYPFDANGGSTETLTPTGSPGTYTFTLTASDGRTATHVVTYAIPPYSYTWTSNSTWTVPAYVTTLNISVTGGGGGGGGSDSYSGLAGKGGNVVSGTGYAVTPGQVISIVVGAGGSGGGSGRGPDSGRAAGGSSSIGNGGIGGTAGHDGGSGAGGGGGGASGIYVGSSIVVAAAGGGGGGGGGINYSVPANGGGGASIGTTGGTGSELINGPKGKGDDGGGGGGGGGGYPLGGNGGGVIRNGYLTAGTSGNGSDTYGASGLNGGNLVPSGFSTSSGSNGGTTASAGGGGSVTISYP